MVQAKRKENAWANEFTPTHACLGPTIHILLPAPIYSNHGDNKLIAVYIYLYIYR